MSERDEKALGAAPVADQALYGGDYRVYACAQLRFAVDKAVDAPCSAMQHERQARLALQLERVPTPTESLDWEADAPRDPEKWPCTFSHHVHSTRGEAVECARARIQVGSVPDSSQRSERLASERSAQDKGITSADQPPEGRTP